MSNQESRAREDSPKPTPAAQTGDRPTIRDVARLAGVSHNAVSLALRHDSRITEATRLRVEEAARELKYRLNPLVSAMMRQHRGGSCREVGEAVAFLAMGRRQSAWRPSSARLRQFEGAVARGREHGLRCERIWADEEGLTGRRLTRILHARGIRGVIVGTVDYREALQGFDWSRFCSVALGRALSEPRLDRVSLNWYHGAVEAFSALRTLGYRKVGLLLKADMLTRMERAVTAVWADEVTERGLGKVPQCIVHTDRDYDLVWRWWKKYRPDAILAYPDYRDVFRERGVEIGYAFLSSRDGQPGIVYDHFALGKTAVDHLATQLLTNSRGLPEVPREIQLEGRWVWPET